MDFNLVWPLIAEIYFIIFIIQIIFLVKFAKELKSKPWSIFVGLLVGTYLFALLSYIILGSIAVDLGSAILTLFISGAVAAVNSIVLIIGLIVRAIKKAKISPAEKKLQKSSFYISGLATLLVGLGIVVAIPTFSLQATYSKNQQAVIDYLEHKYGNHHYQIVKVDNSYGHNGMWDKHLDGYVFSVKSDVTNNIFYVTTAKEGIVRGDYLLEVYYSEQTNVEVSCSIESVYGYPRCSTSDLAIYFDHRQIDEYSLPSQNLGDRYFTTSIIPNDYNHIPTIDEMLQLLANHYSKQHKAE